VIFGTDTSRYQRPGTYHPGEHEVINAEDPTLPAKVARNVAEGRPWGVYLWVYPGQPVPVARRVVEIRSLGYGDPPMGYWWDYEEAGVEPWQLVDAFARADELGVRSGYYCNNHVVDHAAFLSRPFWLAQYPRANDGTFPGFATMRASRPVHLWQFTSTSGTLDQNVVVDHEWWDSWVGLSVKRKRGGMTIVLLRDSGGGFVHEELWTVTGIPLDGADELAGPFGFGQKASTWISNGAQAVVCTPEQFDAIVRQLQELAKGKPKNGKPPG
jgi:hypothetical protein